MTKQWQRRGAIAILLFMTVVLIIGCAQYSNAKVSLVYLEITEASGENITIDDNKINSKNPFIEE